jgi:hypothetical protein
VNAAAWESENVRFVVLDDRQFNIASNGVVNIGFHSMMIPSRRNQGGGGQVPRS